jgi:biopolymer transport protein ExbD
MGKFRNGNKRGMATFSTASLADIVFMLLFLFMVATVLSTEEE